MDPNCKLVTVTAGQETDVKFGNFQTGTRAGYKFEDKDATARTNRTATTVLWRPPLTTTSSCRVGRSTCTRTSTTTAPFELGTDTHLSNAVTDVNGAYSFGALAAGKYIVKRTAPARPAGSRPTGVRGNHWGVRVRDPRDQRDLRIPGHR